MRVLFLSNNPVSQPLAAWLRERVELVESGEPITDASGFDLVVSYSYRHLLRRATLHTSRFINLHISYLPFNRGADPNAWAHLEGTPSGVTIHVIDEGIDTGAILVQHRVTFTDQETLGGTYAALQSEIQRLFRDAWPEIRDNAIIARPQTGKGTHHYAREFAAVKSDLLGEEGWDVTLATLRDRWSRYKKDAVPTSAP